MEARDPLGLAPTREELASRGRVCPKCSYARRGGETAPAWQCPRCGIVYDKYLTGAAAERAVERAAERRRKPEAEAMQAPRRWPWVLAALAIAAGGWGAWQWKARRNTASPEALARLSQVEQVQRDEQVNSELKRVFNDVRPGNPEQALAVFRKYADQGYVRAMTLMGLTYGRPAHASRMEWLRKAANEGDAAAFVNLGYIFETGDAEPRQPEHAANWYAKAARQGDATGLYALGYLHAKGAEGIVRDPRQAYLLLQLSDRAFGDAGSARELGMPHNKTAFWAKGMVRDLEKELSPVDVVKARELADAWKPGQPLPSM